MSIYAHAFAARRLTGSLKRDRRLPGPVVLVWSHHTHVTAPTGTNVQTLPDFLRRKEMT